MKSNRTDSQPNQHATNICLNCQEPECNGGFKGCDFSVEYGLKHKPSYLMQDTCGFKDPFQKTLRDKEGHRRNYERRKTGK